MNNKLINDDSFEYYIFNLKNEKWKKKKKNWTDLDPDPLIHEMLPISHNIMSNSAY